MREQSHKEEMSSLLRGDFDRLRARGVATTLASPAEPEPVESSVEPRHDAVAEPTPAPNLSSGGGAGWLRRFLGAP